MRISNASLASQMLASFASTAPTARATGSGNAFGRGAPQDTVALSTASAALFDALRSGSSASAVDSSVARASTATPAAPRSTAYLFVDKVRTAAVAADSDVQRSLAQPQVAAAAEQNVVAVKIGTPAAQPGATEKPVPTASPAAAPAAQPATPAPAAAVQTTAPAASAPAAAPAQPAAAPAQSTQTKAAESPAATATPAAQSQPPAAQSQSQAQASPAAASQGKSQASGSLLQNALQAYGGNRASPSR